MICMKQHLLSACLATAMFLFPSLAKADVEVNEANFPDAAFRAVLTNLSEGKDGVLTDEEIAGITSLNMIYGNDHVGSIVSLKGIEYLRGLVLLNLYFADNIAGHLDLTANKSLQYIITEGTQLTGIDVTGLTSLKCVVVKATPSMEELRLTGCTALEDVVCGRTGLKSLDVNGLSSLRRLYCYGNKLTSLDVSGLTQLEELDCGDNPLNGLDVSGNTALRGLWCPGNGLTSLDLSANTQLCFLNCADNRISGDDMTALLSSLPQAVGVGQLYLRIEEYDQEHNNYTEEQEQIAVAKNWTILRELPVIVAGAGGGHTLNISTTHTQQATSSDSFYALDGRRLNTPPTKGLYIRNGRKVLMP